MPGSQASGKVANCEVRTEVSQTASVCTDPVSSTGQAEQKLHTEAIRSDEVPHAAEVQSPERGQYRNSRCSSDRHKDIHLTEGGLESYVL